ncbi:uncharacterized protein BDW70DRAFT_98827 [Aspergillus foveolatus]|uniref:uncharacterized protein n=1 Tax=Aspergillus foveolatus TaxID=210207 RepID=UPI003CCD3DFA
MNMTIKVTQGFGQQIQLIGDKFTPRVFGENRKNRGRKLAGINLRTKIPVGMALSPIGRARSGRLTDLAYSSSLRETTARLEYHSAVVDSRMNFFLLLFLVFFTPLTLFIGCYRSLPYDDILRN